MSAAAPRELCIYYRVREADGAAASAQVRDFQARLRKRHPTLQARLLRRPLAVDGRVTWMEVYAMPLQGIDAALQDEIEAAARVLQPLLDGGRHVEVFVEPAG